MSWIDFPMSQDDYWIAAGCLTVLLSSLLVVNYPAKQEKYRADDGRQH